MLCMISITVITQEHKTSNDARHTFEKSLKLSVTKYGSIFVTKYEHVFPPYNADKRKEKGDSHTVTTKYINIHTVSNVKQVKR